MSQEIVIPVRLDEKTFRRFAWFDMFILRKRWVRPVVFSGVMIAFAAAALFTRREQSGLIAAVLLAVGVGLPVVYFGSFLSQVNMQAMRSRLNPPRRVYTVELREEGIRVVNNQKKEDPLTLPWQDIPQAFRARGCVYLYVTPQKAFLLPSGQASVSDDQVWECLNQRLGAGKCVSKVILNPI